MTVKPETFAGGAVARALDLSVLGQQLSLGDTVANIVKGVDDSGKSTYLAKAVGAGELLKSLQTTADSTASSTVTNDGSQNVPAKCAALDLPAQIQAILSVGLACGSSSASLNNGLLHSVAGGQVGDIELSVNSLLHTLGLDSTVQGVGLQVGGLVNTLLGVTQQLGLPVDSSTIPNVGDLLSDVLSSVVNTKTLSVTIGDAKSEVVNTVDTVTAKAHSSAVDIKILPTPTIGGVLQSTPLVEIIVGEANTAATYDRMTGKPIGDPTFDPALVRIKGLVPSLLLHAGPEGLAIPVGQDITLLAGTPLESHIAVAAGKIVDDGTFGKKAVADGVSIELLKGISGGIVLDLAHAEAGAISNLAQTKVLDTPSLDIARGETSLPRTGAETALPLAFAGMAVAIVAVRRYRLAGAAK
ncbi:MAG TPA: hypothetical protein VHC63_02825 [Acidimicrobiales bacterium]|nr:hypothetical protein [Acidimicrobiales bacterium]